MIKLPAMAATPAPENSLMANAHWGWHHLMMEALKERREAERQKANAPKAALP